MSGLSGSRYRWVLNSVRLEFQNIIIPSDYQNTALKFRMWQYKSAREDKITMSSGNRGILQVFRRAAKKAKNFRLFTKRWVSFPEMFVFWISNRFARDRCSLQTRRCTTLFVSLLLHTHQRSIRTFLSKYFFATLANRRVNTHNLGSFSSAIEVYTDKRETAGFWLSLCETNLNDRTWLVQS